MMAGKENESPEIIETEEEYLARLREAVEAALQYFGKTDKSWQYLAGEFAGKLSTYTERVDPSIDHRALFSKCFRMSTELQRCLDLLGVKTEAHGSDYRPDSPSHVYLVPVGISHDVIIDPSIGQFIIGHNHVFVGTRSQLRSLALGTLSESFFERNWGFQSQPLACFGSSLEPSRLGDIEQPLQKTKLINKNSINYKNINPFYSPRLYFEARNHWIENNS